jgi:peptidyl-Lys metalloendopeptidase
MVPADGAILQALGGAITWHRTSKNVFAYVYPGGPVEIWFGPLFWSAPAVGKDSQAGTVVHEVSHEVWATQDHTYGTKNAKQLAMQIPALATDNADNYEYFAEVAP